MTPSQTQGIDLTRTRGLAPLLGSRWLQLVGRMVTLAGFVFTILVALLGTPVGGRNFAILFVWIAWWTALKLVLMPVAGRSWCSVCPIPAPAEWLRQGGIVRPGKGMGLSLRWPRRLRGQWLQLAGFGVMGLFSALLLTRPSATGWILLLLLVAATGIGLVFERRAFCRYLCPIGGYIGWYEQLAPLTVRVRDRDVCKGCTEKACYQTCPWGVFPAALQESFDCGLCMACVRACPRDNMALWARRPGHELAAAAAHRGSRQRLDRAWFGLFMLTCAPVYAAVMLGPWGWLTEAAYAVGSPAWFLYAAAFLAVTLGVGPGLFWLAARAGWRLDGRREGAKQAAVDLGHAISPLGLAAWIGFTMSFAFSSLAYVWPVLSDPMGLGWNLFGTAGWGWRPYLAGITPALQVFALVGGLLWSGVEVRRLATPRQALPVLVYGTLFTAVMLWLVI